ncbi:hypothetical protein BMS3Bbin15_00027 [archaeon BMS3Bbin15]|nr:hypothetical protein BMS3Bbin15_00027 [archaeon BMS3Bbin15]
MSSGAVRSGAQKIYESVRFNIQKELHIDEIVGGYRLTERSVYEIQPAYNPNWQDM